MIEQVETSVFFPTGTPAPSTARYPLGGFCFRAQLIDYMHVDRFAIPSERRTCFRLPIHYRGRKIPDTKARCVCCNILPAGLATTLHHSVAAPARSPLYCVCWLGVTPLSLSLSVL